MEVAGGFVFMYNDELVVFLVFVLFLAGITAYGISSHEHNRTEIIELCIKHNVPLDKCQ